MKQGDLFGGDAPKKKDEPKPPPPPAARGATDAQAEPAYLREHEPPPPEGSQAPIPPTLTPAPVFEGPRPTPVEPLDAPKAEGVKPEGPKAEPPRWVPPKAEEPPRPAKRREEPPAPRVLTVSELTWALKDAIEPRFSEVFVRGEVSGFRGPNARGHLYFTLKDETASLDVRIWQSTAQRLKFALKDGLEVIASGSIDVYAPSGRYGLIVQRIEPAGVGAQALAFEQLKQRLAAEGLIGEKRTKPKKALPLLPRRIGVVTSTSGAALRDFLKVLHRRHPRLEVLVADARVQGDGAAFEIARGIRRLARTAVDLIVVTRGGGSAEDLWAFNEEVVARAIFESEKPIVSAVGHETDTTLADYVADVRAPTPSAAAEAIAPVLADLELHLAQQRARMRRALEKRLLAAHHQLRALQGQLGDPRRRLSQQRLFLSEQAERIARVLRRAQRERRDSLKELAARLQQARPQARLEANRRELAALAQRLIRASPQPRVARERERVRTLGARLATAVKRDLARDRQLWSTLAGKLDVLSPLAVLARGYALVQRAADGKVVREAAQAPVGERLRIRLEKDEIAATVEPGQKKLL